MKRFLPLFAIVFVVAAITALCCFPGTIPVSATSVNPPAESKPGDIEVLLPELTSIQITKMPTKLTYVTGQSLDLSGLEVTAYYTSGNPVVLTQKNFTVSGYRTNTPGNQTISVYYKGKSTTFRVTVFALGDCDGDGAVTPKDATLLLQYTYGLPVEINTAVADYNADGAITREDATLLMQQLAGWNK